ncbi:hypothetical protein PBCVAN69C_671L [Paramecium bursaria Chlorella virus AN69C]|uniref:Uncharacterized protein n=1 Tax=Paramecium bursaria Chlorella virus IL3A TaxID=46019 RepID=M1H5F3_PBCVI|nr:hypothetical protein PBCVAN69C_671L [Paramecium bursaria Chlorella virus AN69C]AGE53943.1 hypothetical protein PBCVIL3A_500R [Paramecium bursaria Chlorella virus IL3A]AGE57373.1 hypothetical protein PBCVNEJV4_508R [Paramecium bursaria Chlorella virus NE-JV-4]
MFSSKPPRRAVIVDGAIQEKKNHPGSVEIEAISKLMEQECERQGGKSIPRFTTQLMEKAISTNDADCWEAMCDDIDTGDFDSSAVTALFSQNETLPVMFITCLVTSKDINQFMMMLRVFYVISKDFTEEIKDVVSKTITCQSKSFLDVLIRFVPYVKRDLRDAVLEEISKFINVTELGVGSIVEMITVTINMKKFEFLRIFMNIDTSKCFENNKLFETIVSKVKNTPATQKHYIISFIAKIITEIPTLADEFQTQLKDMITHTLNLNIQYGYSDTRTVGAIGFISEKVFDDPVIRNLGTLLSWSVSKK